jgi:predicted DNA binding CopG/RHH family protein
MSTTKEPITKPDFKSEDEEAEWWASAEGRAFLKQQAASRGGGKRRVSSLVSGLNTASSVQIALRLPTPDAAQASEIAERKGIGYQTLLKMLIHEGLQREAKRK